MWIKNRVMKNSKIVYNIIFIAHKEDKLANELVKKLKNFCSISIEEDILKILEKLELDKKNTIIFLSFEFSADFKAKIIEILKTSFFAYNIPIIYLVPQNDLEEIKKGIELGIDDYIEYPGDEERIMSRIYLNIKRSQAIGNLNALTHLPGGELIYNVVNARLQEPLAMLYIDIDHFKAYNDHLGFDSGDKALIHTAKIIKNAILKFDPVAGYVGNIGGDDFILVTTPELAEAIAEYICKEFDNSIGQFYPKEDITNKGFLSKDRNGNIVNIPLMTLSIAIITTEHMKKPTYAKISNLATQLKEYAKTKPSGKYESNFIIERRHE